MAARKQTITKLTLACAVACLLTITPQPLLSQDVDQLIRQGASAYDRADFLEAESIFRQVIDIDPNDAFAYYSLGRALSDQGKLEEAIANYQQAIELDPNFAIAYNDLGNALRQQGKLEEAIANYQQAIELDPKVTGIPDDIQSNDPKLSSAQSLGNLNLRLAKQTYILNLEQINIPEINITSNQNSYQALELKYIPQTQEPQLNILSPTQIRINLPEKTNTQPDQETENYQWFYEDFDVKDVDFYRFQQSSNVRDEIQKSTIISGKLRMHRQDLNLEKNQFLIVDDDKPGIRKLRYLSINPQQPPSLTTFISGKSKGIATGLYPQFPITQIQPSLLAKYLSSEAIAAVLSFFSAFTALVIEKVLFKDT